MYIKRGAVGAKDQFGPAIVRIYRHKTLSISNFYDPFHSGDEFLFRPELRNLSRQRLKAMRCIDGIDGIPSTLSSNQKHRHL